MKLLFKLLPIALILSHLAFAASYTVSDGTFTDSQGQTAKYRIGIPDNYVPGAKGEVLINLHGNNTGTQDDMLNMWYATTERRADVLGLIPIVIASPGTRNDGITRQWSEAKDPQMLDELLQSHFQSKITVDFNRVFLWGASQGTCFINSFLLAKSDNYLGGALGYCGCFNYLANDFTPSQSFMDNYRFYILSTTEDFLYDGAVNGYQFYRWTAGVKNIRGDLDRSGDHCTAPESAIDSALAWIVGDINTPETQDEVHWQRIATIDTVKGLTISTLNKLIVGSYNGNNGKVSISDDQGDSWTTALDIVGEALTSVVASDDDGFAVLTGSNYYRYDKNYQLVDQATEDFTSFLRDGMDNLYKLGGNSSMEVSIDNGINWTASGFGSAERASVGQNFIDMGSSQILASGSWRSYSLTNKAGADAIISLPTQNLSYLNFSKHDGKLLLYGWDYNDNWKPYAWTSSDQGVTWTPVILPTGFDIGYSGYGVGFYHDGSLVYYGSNETMLSSDNGATWTSEVNLGYHSDPFFTKDKDQVVYTSNGVGIFRKQTWLTSAARPTHTDGDTKTSLILSQNLDKNLDYQRFGNLLIIRSDSRVEINSLNLNGQSQSLYQGNPQGKALVDLSDVPRGHLIQIKSLSAQNYQTQFLR